VAVVEPLLDDPLPITCECEKNTLATMNAKAEMQTSNNPMRRLVEILIRVMPQLRQMLDQWQPISSLRVAFVSLRTMLPGRC
jgi:hypothetical protein